MFFLIQFRPPDLAVIRAEQSTPEILQHVIDACESGRLGAVDEPDPKDPSIRPINLALEKNRLDFIDVLINHISPLTTIINKREVSLFGSILSRREAAATDLAYKVLRRVREVLGPDSKGLAAYVNRSLDHGSTPLSRAAETGHVNLLNILLESGADPFATALERKRKTTAIHNALQKG